MVQVEEGGGGGEGGEDVAGEVEVMDVEAVCDVDVRGVGRLGEGLFAEGEGFEVFAFVKVGDLIDAVAV